MFEMFKRKKKDVDDQNNATEAAESSANSSLDGSTNSSLNNSANSTPEQPIDEAKAAIPKAAVPQTAVPKVHTQDMAKAGTPAGEEVVFFKESAELEEAKEKKGFFSRLATGLSKTRSGFSDGVAHLLLGKKEIDDDLLEDLETQLVMADVGVEATREIMAKLTERVGRKELTDSDALFEALIKELQDILAPCEQPLVVDSGNKPYVILMVGINGVGKTTTIGKLAKQFQAKGKSVMLAAGDTFRAAAVEQLQVWGERNDVPVVAQHTGADSASVLYDALEAATARGLSLIHI